MIKKYFIHCLLFCCVVVLIFACEKYSDIFRTQAIKFMEDGSAMSSNIKTGVNYFQMRSLYEKANGSYGLLMASCPKDKLPEVRKSFEKALEAWDLCMYLWANKINKFDNPTEPNINKYKKLIDFAGEKLIIETHKDNFIVKDYRGKKYIPFDNIGILMSVGNEEFEKGRAILIEKLS